MDYQEYQRSSHLSHANAQIKSSPTRQTCDSTNYPTNCQNKPNCLHKKIFMNYTPSYKKTWLAKQRALEMIHGNWEESYAKLPKLFRTLQSCIPGTVVAAQTESLYGGTNSTGQKIV